MPAASSPLAWTPVTLALNQVANSLGVVAPESNGGAFGIWTLCWAPPLTEINMLSPMLPVKSNVPLAPASATFWAAEPWLSGTFAVTISLSGPPTSAGRLPWNETALVAWAGSVSDVGTVMVPPEELTTRRPVRRSTSARSASMPNDPTRE